MKESHEGSVPGRIEERTAGFGLPSEDEIEERAKEIAIIQGRSKAHVTEADRAQARRELLGETDTDPEDGETVAGTKAFDEAPGSTGHQTPDYLPEDEATVGERLVQEGVETAGARSK